MDAKLSPPSARRRRPWACPPVDPRGPGAPSGGRHRSSRRARTTTAPPGRRLRATRSQWARRRIRKRPIPRGLPSERRAGRRHVGDGIGVVVGIKLLVAVTVNAGPSQGEASVPRDRNKNGPESPGGEDCPVDSTESAPGRDRGDDRTRRDVFDEPRSRRRRANAPGKTGHRNRLRRGCVGTEVIGQPRADPHSDQRRQNNVANAAKSSQSAVHDHVHGSAASRRTLLALERIRRQRDAVLRRRVHREGVRAVLGGRGARR